ncbi:lysophospholipase [Effusibacillus lacus]|uniref:Lysophospholipase n=2 Tax=Effusibacillus lacus TaxID=1348429 RepID=A0A292YLB8_9BACL|nr:lysophospholipase [Effusibacillus lacus]
MFELMCWNNGKRFRAHDQEGLFYRALVPSDSRIILIMIHGAGQHSGQFFDLGEFCFRHSIAFYALDLRGFGQSTGQRGHINTFSQYLKDLDDFISVVRKQHEPIPLFLLGHSLGGIIVIRYVQERQNNVQGIILSAPALKLRFQIPKTLRFACQALSWLTPELCFDLNMWSVFLSKLGFELRMQNGVSTEIEPSFITYYSVRWCNEFLINANYALKKAGAIQNAVLSLCGEEDPLVDPDSVREFHDCLKVKDKKFISISNAKHRLLQDKHNTPNYQYIIGWLNERIEVKYCDSHE